MLNLGSIDAPRSRLGHSAYAASECGIVALTRALAVKLANDGICVSTICPVTAKTPMVTSFAKPSTMALIGSHPSKRISIVEEQGGSLPMEPPRRSSSPASLDSGRAVR